MLQYKQYILESSELPTRIFDPVTNKITTIDPKIVCEEKNRFFNSIEANKESMHEIKMSDELGGQRPTELAINNQTTLTKGAFSQANLPGWAIQNEYSPDEEDFEIQDSESFQYEDSFDGSEEYEGVDEVINFSDIHSSSGELLEVLPENDEIRSKHTAYTTGNLYSEDNQVIPREIWDKESPFSDLQDLDLLCKSDSCKICTK